MYYFIYIGGWIKENMTVTVTVTVTVTIYIVWQYLSLKHALEIQCHSPPSTIKELKQSSYRTRRR